MLFKNQTKSDLLKIIEDKQNKINQLNEQLTSKEKEYKDLEEICLNFEKERDSIRQKLKNLEDDMEFDTSASYENSDKIYTDIIVSVMPLIAKKCGILNNDNNQIDWLDLKPSLYQSRILRRLKELEKGVLTTSKDISEWMCIWLYNQAYNSQEFQRYWRQLSKMK